jgi:type I restriction enzyme S subunit
MLKNLTPYEGYRDASGTVAVLVPSHWSVRRLGSLFDLKGSGTTPQGDAYYGGGVPFVATGDLNDTTVRRTTRTVTESALRDHSALKLHPPGTLLVAMYTATMGRTGILAVPSTCNQASCAFASPRAGVLVRYAQLATTVSRPLLLLAAAGGVQANVNAEKVSRLPLPLPPASEQAAIVKYLGHAHRRIDRAIAAKRRLVAMLAEQRQAVVNRAVTRGLDPTVPMRDSGIPWLGEIPAHWEVLPLKRTSRIEGGFAFPSSLFGEVGTPVVRMNNLRRGRVDLTGAARISPSAGNERFALAAGDTLYGLSGSVGRTGSLGNFAVVMAEDLPAYLNQRIARLTPLPARMSQKYLVLTLQSTSCYEQVLAGTTGTAQFNVSPLHLQNVQVALPPGDEQEQIVSFVSEADRQILEVGDRSRREIDLLREFRARLTSDVATGQVDVRDIAASLPESLESVGPEAETADDDGLDDELTDELDEPIEEVNA